MASSIGGNHFHQINQQLAKGPDANTLENLRQAGGTAASQSKFSAPKGKTPAQESGGVHLSEAAKKSLAGNNESELELAHHAGLGEELQPESRHEQHVERGNQRYQESVKEQVAGGPQQQPHPEAPSAPDSADKVQARLTAAKLAAYDDPETVFQKVLDDIPEANMEAAERVLESQLKREGMKKVSNLKVGPEAQEAGKMEMRQADFMGSPLDIRDSENDRSAPMPLEFPDEMLEVAKERAAEGLAAGETQPENLL